MKLNINTTSYNERRYGKPYIAKMAFGAIGPEGASIIAKGIPTWGQWVGQAGEPGMLILECEPGDVVMRGQRDTRNMKHSVPDFYIVQADGSLAECSKVDAYQAWQAKQAN